MGAWMGALRDGCDDGICVLLTNTQTRFLVRSQIRTSVLTLYVLYISINTSANTYLVLIGERVNCCESSLKDFPLQVRDNRNEVKNASRKERT